MGSSTFPLSADIGAQIVDAMRGYDDDTAFLTRGAPGFDQFVMVVAPLIGRRCFTYLGSGSDNWQRDIELVRDADEVIAFLDPATLSDHNTGTGHLLDVALQNEKPTKAYTVVEGQLVWAGESDGATA